MAKHKFSLLAAGVTFHGGWFVQLCAVEVRGAHGALFEAGYAVDKHDKARSHPYCDIFWWQLIRMLTLQRRFRVRERDRIAAKTEGALA